MKSCLSKSVLSVWRGRNLSGSLEVTVFQHLALHSATSQGKYCLRTRRSSTSQYWCQQENNSYCYLHWVTCHLFFFSLSVLSCIIVIIPFIWTSLNLDPPWGGYSPKDYFSLENTHMLFFFFFKDCIIYCLHIWLQGMCVRGKTLEFSLARHFVSV